MDIDELLKIAIERDSSDLHLKVGNHPVIRVHGSLIPLTSFPRLTANDTQELSEQLMADYQKARLKEDFDIDLAYSLPGFGRFRGSIFMQRGSTAIALRIIPLEVKTIRQLLLPEVLEKIALYQRGLVLCTGTTGSGKTTTLAAMIDHVNTNRRENIITVEDPIEYLHKDKKSMISQREIGMDVTSFARGLRASLREDPDVILVGEMRDLETIGTALLAAETGHMVFSTLHTLDATETIQRIIAVFPPPEQKQIRLQMATTLRAVISQRLVRKSDGIGRVPAVEILIATEYIRDCVINPDKTRLIHDAIAAGVSQYGMQTFDQSLYDLYTQGLITLEEALANSSNPDEFKLRIAGIRSTGDAAREEMERSSQTDRFAKR